MMSGWPVIQVQHALAGEFPSRGGYIYPYIFHCPPMSLNIGYPISLQRLSAIRVTLSEQFTPKHLQYLWEETLHHICSA